MVRYWPLLQFVDVEEEDCNQNDWIGELMLMLMLMLMLKRKIVIRMIGLAS